MLGRGQDAASAPLSHGAVRLRVSSFWCPSHASRARSQAGRAPPSLWLALWPLLAPPVPPDSAGSLPGRPVTGNSHWALAQPHATPWDPSPMCTEELMGFVPGEAAAPACPALRRLQPAYLAPSARSLLPLEVPGGRSSCFCTAWGSQRRSRVVGSCLVPGSLRHKGNSTPEAGKRRFGFPVLTHVCPWGACPHLPGPWRGHATREPCV